MWSLSLKKKTSPTKNTPPMYEPHNDLRAQGISCGNLHLLWSNTRHVGTWPFQVWSLTVLNDKDRVENFVQTWKSKTKYLFCGPCFLVFASVTRHVRVSYWWNGIFPEMSAWKEFCNQLLLLRNKSSVHIKWESLSVKKQKTDELAVGC